MVIINIGGFFSNFPWTITIEVIQPRKKREKLLVLQVQKSCNAALHGIFFRTQGAWNRRKCQAKKSGDFINGNFRNLNWRYPQKIWKF